jgi:TonB family protein
MSTRLEKACCTSVFVCVLFATRPVLAQCVNERIGLDSVLTQESVALVFVGRVVNVEHAGSTETVTFEVERVWKGPVKERTMIYRPTSAAGQTTESPIVFSRTRYIVIAHRLDVTERKSLGLDDREDAFGTNTCGDGSRPLASTEPDLGKLGPGREPLRPQVPIRNPKVATPIRTKVVSPVYPEDARAAGIRATVIVEITIDETGRVTKASVLRSIPLLNQAAIDCVMQWEFLPTLMVGRPVPVILTVLVTFPP